MAREKNKPVTAVAVVDATINNTALVEASDAAQQRGDAYYAIAQKFNYTLGFNLDRMRDEVSHYLAEATRAMLEAGMRLLLIRSQTVHGEWLDTLTHLKLEERKAQKMCKVAELYAANPAISPLIDRLRMSQMFEMLTLDAEDMATIGSGGSVDGLGDLDDIAMMTVADLRAAVREARDIAVAKDNLLTEKTATINELQLKKKMLKPPAPDENMKALRRELSDVTSDIEANIRGALRDGIKQLIDGAEVGNEDVDAFVTGLLGQVSNALVHTADFLGLMIPETEAQPEWVNDEPDESDADHTLN